MSSFTETFNNREAPYVTREPAWSRTHRDLQATAMSVDWSGQWVLLAGRRHLALQKLDIDQMDDDNFLRKFHRNSKHEISAAEWAICQESQEYCAIATSQLIEVVTWRSGDPTLIHSLRAHTRVITDIDWHSKTPHLLASCSIDTFTHLWDLRDPKKPTMSLSAVCMSGATQVGFNRVSGNLLATAHDGDLRIWDLRKGSCPIQYITAHLARIHGINWSHKQETHLTTASQDGTVKYFDIKNPRRAEKIITTSSPVWRARYTPFADGLVTVIVPNLGRGENSLLLWNNAKQSAPICSFLGHSDVILDFAWRPNRSYVHSDMELVTWSRDQTLRVWNVDESTQKMCETESPDEDESESAVSGVLLEQGIPIKSKPSSSLTLTKHFHRASITSDSKLIPKFSLQHEFSLLNTNIPHIDIEVLDAVKRHAMIRVSANGHVIMLQVVFPTDYPHNDYPPEFIYCQGTSIDDNLAESLIEVLKANAQNRLKKGKTCLEQCLRALVTTLKKITSTGDKSYLRLQSPRLEGALTGALHDACVPFPKTSGARFSQVGILVTFIQPLNSKGISFRHQNTTPRALSALNNAYLGNVMGTNVVTHRDSNSSIFLQERVRKSSRIRNAPAKLQAATIHVYDVSKALTVNKRLAEEYIIDSENIVDMCLHNKAVAKKYGNADTVQCWTLAHLIASSITNNNGDSLDDETVFQQIPFPKILLESLIGHFAQNYDLQTAAMLCCAFGRHCPPSSEISRSSSLSGKSLNTSVEGCTVHTWSYGKSSISCQKIEKWTNLRSQAWPSGSPYHTIMPVDSKSNHSSWNLAVQWKQMRSNSWSDSLDDCRIVPAIDINRTLLGDSQRHLYDNYKRAYAEMLYRWNLLLPRAKVLKYISVPAEPYRDVEFVAECMTCLKVSRSPVCKECHSPLLKCSLCRLPVRGLANACLSCGHGGHSDHMKKWFSTNDTCAFGCGCQCMNYITK